MPVVNFVNEKKQIEVEEGANLRAVAIKHGIKLYPWVNRYVNCHGFSQCGTCRVLITKGIENAGKESGVFANLEKLRLKLSLAYIGNEDLMRLACQTTVDGDMEVVTRPSMNWFGENFYS